jgi:alkaline phosphatase D
VTATGPAGTGVTRRQLIRRAGAVAGAAAVLPSDLAGAATHRRRSPSAGGHPVPVDRTTFAHGVASGDPLADAVVLWTRVSGRPGPVVVRWEVATDPSFADVVAAGAVTTGPHRDWTVKVDVGGLSPATSYAYRFLLGPAASRTGRTRTAPMGPTAHLRLGVATCGDWRRGLWNAYARLAERDDLDVVVHLGDYIYENGNDTVRPHQPPRECRTLEDYRARYASYRGDWDGRPTELQDLHAAVPMIWVWDDHETVDGAWMRMADPSNHGDDDGESVGSYRARADAALQAAREWMPIRGDDPADERVYRAFAFGDLVDLVMLDTRRIGRDEQGPESTTGFRAEDPPFADPRRHILRAAQREWLAEQLATSTARWRLLGNQVVLSHLKIVGAPAATGLSRYANPDQWDGYPHARDRVLDMLEQTGDVVVLTGDVHAALAFEVTRDPNDPAVYDPATGRGVLAAEFVAPSISSAGDPDPLDPTDPEGAVEALVLQGLEVLRASNPHGRYVRTTRNGYCVVDVTRERVAVEFWYVPTVTALTDRQELERTFTVVHGDPRIHEDPVEAVTARLPRDGGR